MNRLDTDSYETAGLLFLNMYDFWEDFVYILDNCLSSCLNRVWLSICDVSSADGSELLTWRFSLVSSWEQITKPGRVTQGPKWAQKGIEAPSQIWHQPPNAWFRRSEFILRCTQIQLLEMMLIFPMGHLFTPPEGNMQVFHRTTTVWSGWSSNPLRSWPKLWHSKFFSSYAFIFCSIFSLYK